VLAPEIFVCNSSELISIPESRTNLHECNALAFRSTSGALLAQEDKLSHTLHVEPMQPQ